MRNRTAGYKALRGVFMIVLGLSVVIVLASGTRRAKAFTTFNVMNTANSGPGSLRQAILDANANPGADTITFAATVAGTIMLTTGQLPTITEDLTIVGPGPTSITVSGNHTSRVFVVASGITVMISGLTISNGTADTFGGGIFNSGTLSLLNTVVSANSAFFGGGGIFNNAAATLAIINSTLSGNFTSGPGGGIANSSSGTVTVTGSTLSGNTAIGSGGGISIPNVSTLTVTNSTLSGNTSSGNGGGIRNFAGTVNISFSTLSGNSAQSGGGVFNDTTTMNIKNSIVANSPSGGDCSNTGTFNATGTNFSTSGTCPGFTQVTPAQLNLGPLANNGGPTQTHALRPGSEAIDAVIDCTDVNGDLVTTDQRGVGRPVDGDGDGVSRCDAGAYEAPAVMSFDFCIQDDSNGNLFEFNSQTGDYQFSNCRKGFTLTGRGTITVRFCKVELEDVERDRNISVLANTCTHAGTASIRDFSRNQTFTISDRDITNNTCACR